MKGKKFAGIMVAVLIISCMKVEAAENLESQEQSNTYELNFEGFKNAVQDGIAAREEAGNTLQNEKVSESEIEEKYRNIAECEWEYLKDFDQDFLQTDTDAQIKVENYIRKEYVEGVKIQKEAGKNSDEETFVEEWKKGYEMRSCALTELVVLYQCIFDDSVKDEMINSDELDESSEKNVVMIIQAFEVAAGKLTNGSAIDGQAGKQTVIALKAMQEEAGKLTNGIINRNRIQELKESYPDLIEDVNTLLKGPEIVVDNYLQNEENQE